jgi:putative membrane protein insertion efficiency factor
MRALARVLVRGYQKLLSPLLSFLGGPYCGCRFSPTCSEYFLDAVERHGLLRGAWLGARRLLRCHPWGGSGFDPVPEAPPSLHRCACK